MSSEPIYRITFFNQQEVYEIYAQHVFQSDLWGFLEVEEFVFGERSQMIVDPAEEKLKNEFSGSSAALSRCSLWCVLMKWKKRVPARLPKFTGRGGNVRPFPFPSMAGQTVKE